MKKLLLATLFLSASLSAMGALQREFLVQTKQKQKEKEKVITSKMVRVSPTEWEKQKDWLWCGTFAVLGVATFAASCYLNGFFNKEIQ